MAPRPLALPDRSPEPSEAKPLPGTGAAVQTGWDYSSLFRAHCILSEIKMRKTLEDSLVNPAHCTRGVCALYLDGLGYVHLVNFNLRKATAGHIFVLLLIAIEEVSGVDANADGPLGQRSEQSAQGRCHGMRNALLSAVPLGPGGRTPQEHGAWTSRLRASSSRAPPT